MKTFDPGGGGGYRVKMEPPIGANKVNDPGTGGHKVMDPGTVGN